MEKHLTLNKNTYLLMNKDKVVAFFEKKNSLFEGDVYFEFLENVQFAKLPIGFSDITTWIEGRKASKHNSHLKEIMERLNCADSEGFIRTTHATSINDTFWVKKIDEPVSWKDVSLYENEFTETISALALEGIGLYNEQFSSTGLPEFVSDGSFPKCFTKEDDEIFIYKGGARGAFNVGLEPYCEVLASEIATYISTNAVSYELKVLHGRLASKCKLFTDENKGYVPFRSLTEKGKIVTLDNAFRYFEKLGSEDAFREMLLLDALVFNTDRHPGNYGVLIDNNNLEVLKMAPIFDLNLSLFPYLLDSEFDNIGDNMLKYGPVLGNDFTRIGQQALTPLLQEKLRDLCDYQFSFQGDDKFTKTRVKKLEEIVSRQAEAILSNEKLRTRDVFIPETPDEIKVAVKDKSQEMEFFADNVDALGLPVLVSLDADSHRAVVVIEPEIPGKCDYLFEFDFINVNATIFIDFKPITIGTLQNSYPEFYEIYKTANILFCNIMNGKTTPDAEPSQIKEIEEYDDV